MENPLYLLILVIAVMTAIMIIVEVKSKDSSCKKRKAMETEVKDRENLLAEIKNDLSEVRHNTSIIRGWATFFGITTIIGMIVWIITLISAATR